MAHTKPKPGTTSPDISGLKIKGDRTQRSINEHEAENIRQAMLKYDRPTRRQAPFDYSWVLKLHKQMFGKVWSWAGATRTTNLNFGVDWQHVESSVLELLKDLRYWEQSGLDMVTQAAMLHHRAVRIHPFKNGNGRWARLLANIWLALHKHPQTQWPDVSGETSPNRYLAAIQSAETGDLEPLISLHRELTPTA